MSRKISWKLRRPVRWLGAGSAAIFVSVAAAAAFDQGWRDKSAPAQGSATHSITATDLANAGRTKVFFGHQSVGENVLGGVPDVYAARGIPAPPIEQARTVPGPSGGFITHEFIGENGHPFGKIDAFAKTLHGGMASKVNVALMKFCYIDFAADTDVDALFAHYRDTMAALERKYPELALIHTTVPLTTQPGLKSRLKAMLGGSGRFGPAENLVRERFNTLMLREYSDKHLFDLAEVESTAPDGTRDAHRHDGQEYFALYRGYASDIGHLNHAGSEIAATAFLEAIAKASGFSAR